MPNPPPRSSRLPRPIRIVMGRPRLFTSLAIGFLTFLILSFTRIGVVTAALLGWNVCIVLYLTFAFGLARRSEGEDIRRRARREDDGKIAVLILTAVAAFASLGAIFALLGTGGATRQPGQLVIATLTIVLSWAFTHTTFGLHYAHEYYDEKSKEGGLEFPGNATSPDYWDFLYFSFVIGMCAQVSDITVSARPIRRTVFAHSVIAFFFNAALLALTVNIAASALAGSPG